VIRSIHYNKYTAPENKNAISLKTKANVKAESEGKLEALFKNGFELKSDDTYIYVYGDSAKIKHKNTEVAISDGRISCNSEGSSGIYENDRIALSVGNSSITLSSDGIQLSCGGSTIDLSDSSISLNSSDISTMPPVCKCQGGL
jgi:hypothetical protein